MDNVYHSMSIYEKKILLNSKKEKKKEKEKRSIPQVIENCLVLFSFGHLYTKQIFANTEIKTILKLYKHAWNKAKMHSTLLKIIGKRHLVGYL